MALKAIESATAVIGKVYLVYDKDEADKVIAEKHKEITELQKQIHDYAQGLYVIQATAEKEHRRQKRKRCIAMARQCDDKATIYRILINDESCKIISYRYAIKLYSKKKDRYEKWRKKWMEIADKFKE